MLRTAVGLVVLLTALALNATNETTTSTLATTTTTLNQIKPAFNGTCIKNGTQCVYDSSGVVCEDLCAGFPCSKKGQKCNDNQDLCKAECVCENDWERMDSKGECYDVCHDNPCLFNGTCYPDEFDWEYTCNCTEGFEGQRCQNVENICLRAHPPLCPFGSFTCDMLSANQYSCDCIEGYWKDANNTCIKVDQTVDVTMHFKEKPYSDEMNNISSKASNRTRTTIQKAFSLLYSDHLLSLRFGNFSHGSLVAHLHLQLSIGNDTAKENKYRFDRLVVDCNNDPNPKNESCFADLGNVYLPDNAWIEKDLRCTHVICPQSTVCQAEPDRTVCVCQKGYEATGAYKLENEVVIAKCRDIDECLTLPPGTCSIEETCRNTDGSFQCQNPCSDVTCPGSSYCVPSGTSHSCQCGWMYAGSQCSFPWTLILLISTVLLLITTVLLSAYLLHILRRNRVGTIRTTGSPWQ